MTEAGVKNKAITIRKAGAADLPACARIVNDWMDETDWFPRIYSRDEIEGFFTSDLLEKRTVWLAEMNGGIAGYLSIDADGNIHAIYIAAAYRCTGTGKMMLDHVKSLHPEGLELDVFEESIHARRFYEREGFAEVPERRKEETEEGIPELLMRWRGG